MGFLGICIVVAAFVLEWGLTNIANSMGKRRNK